MITSSSLLTRYDHDTVRKLLRDLFHGGIHIDLIFQTMDQADLLELFYSRNVAEYDVLFSGTRFAPLNTHSPYLYRVETLNDVFFSHILEQQAGWGCIVASSASFRQVASHWKHLLEAELPDGMKTHLRLYDGNILSILLPACTKGDLHHLFGPCGMVFVRGKEEKIPWIHAVHPSLQGEEWVLPVKQWEEEQPHQLWNMLPHHFAPFKSQMHAVHIANLQQTLWKEDAGTALRVDAAHAGLAAFVEMVLAEADEFGLEEDEDRDAYLLLRFYADHSPEKSAELRAVMQEGRGSPAQRLERARRL